MHLSAFVALCEGYLGVRPTVAIWSRCCYLRAQTVDEAMTDCGAASIYSRPGAGYPKVKPL